MSAPKILVVEDTKSWQETYVEWFSGEDYAVTVAATLEDALKACQESRFDLAVVDINLSKGAGNRDGLKLVDTLRSDFPKTHIIIVSGSIDSDLAEQLRAQNLVFVPRNELQYLSFLETIRQKLKNIPSD